MEKIKLSQLASKLTKPYTPIEVCNIDDYHCYLSLLQGEYPFHKHDGDEFFLVIEGETEIDLEGESITLGKHEGLLVPKGVVHRPNSKGRTIALIFESKALASHWVEG